LTNFECAFVRDVLLSGISVSYTYRLYVLALWILCVSITIAFALYDLRSAILLDLSNPATLSNVLVGLVIGAVFIMSIDLALRAFETRHYLRLRWKAWTGPSRTGISPAMVGYIGNLEDWATLLAWAGNIQQHPVERFAGSFLGKSNVIVEDPTDLLRIRAVLDQEGNSSWTPQSQERPLAVILMGFSK
jgi:hypothetical protein